MVTVETRKVYTFATIIAGRRRSFSSKPAAYRALAVQLLTRRYTEIVEVDIGEGDSAKVREWTERGAALFADDYCDTFASRNNSHAWLAQIDAVAAKLRKLDEYRARRVKS